MSGRPRPPAVAPPPYLRKRQIPRPPPPRKRAAPAPPPPPLPPAARPLLSTRPELQRQGYRDRSAPRPTAKRYTVFGSGTRSAHCGDVLTKRMKCERHSSAEQPAHCGDVSKKNTRLPWRSSSSAKRPARSGDVDGKHIECEQPRILLTRPEIQREGYGDGSAPRPTAKRYTVCGSGTRFAQCGDVPTKRMKTERHSSAEQPAHCDDVSKKNSRWERRSSNSAQPPARCGDVDGKHIECEQPCNHRLSGAIGNKRIKREQPDRTLLTSVAYLHLSEITEKALLKGEAHVCAIEALQQALAVGAEVINMVFQRPLDIDLVWVELCDEIQANDEHPQLEYRRNHTLLTIFSPNCGALIWEDYGNEYEEKTGVPTICLTFNGPSNSGNMVIFNTACPWLSQCSRTCMLDTYSSESLEEMDSIRVIGGQLYLLPYGLDTPWDHNLDISRSDHICESRTKSRDHLSEKTWRLRRAKNPSRIQALWSQRLAKQKPTLAVTQGTTQKL